MKLRVALLSCLGLLSACGSWDAPEPVEECPSDPPPSAARTGFHVVGNRIEDAQGNRVVLRGVNRSGSEYRCIQGHGFFDGPDDEASVQAMKSWNVNAVRIPLNESCWLDVNGAPPELSGCNYKTAIRNYVNLLHRHGITPILDLHWTGPNGLAARRLQPMPNQQHSRAFWYDVAKTFEADAGVIFEPFNEPFPDSNQDTPRAWRCWRDGCTLNEQVAAEEVPQPYEAVGMQELVNVIRRAGSKHLILLGGVQYSNGLSQILEYLPHDPLGNLAVAWHVYNNNPCRDSNCWNGAPLAVAATLPLVATELGQNDCTSSMVSPLLDWLAEHSSGYLAWTWNAYGPCRLPTAMRRGSPWSLVTDYESATPNSEYAQVFRDHLARFAP